MDVTETSQRELNIIPSPNLKKSSTTTENVIFSTSSTKNSRIVPSSSVISDNPKVIFSTGGNKQDAQERRQRMLDDWPSDTETESDETLPRKSILKTIRDNHHNRPMSPIKNVRFVVTEEVKIDIPVQPKATILDKKAYLPSAPQIQRPSIPFGIKELNVERKSSSPLPIITALPDIPTSRNNTGMFYKFR